MTFNEKVTQLQRDLDSQINFFKTAYLRGWCTKKEQDRAIKIAKNEFIKNLRETMEYAVLGDDRIRTPEEENMYQARNIN